MLEPAPYWAPELRRRFLREPVDVQACRRRADLQGRDLTRAILLLEVDGNERECIEVLRSVRRVFTVFLASGANAGLELPFRDAGACSFLRHPLSGKELARLLRRIWRTLA